MAAKKETWLVLVTVFVLVSVSCNLPFMAAQITPTVTQPTPVNATEVAQTVIAGLLTPVKTLTNTVQPPVDATRTPEPPVVPPTITPSITLTTRPCNLAAFLADVTIPDGTEIQTNATFTKTWRLQNNGSCTWTSGYHVIFDTGDRMNAPDAVSVTGGTVPFGGSAEVTVTLKAPASAGTYKGYFRLRSPDGIVFGIGGGGPFYVQIVAVAPEAQAQPPVLEIQPPLQIVLKPDLIISDITLSPNPPKKGQAVTVKVSSYNQGNSPAGAYTVKWWPGENYPAPACTWNIGGMVAKGGQVHTCVYAGYPSAYSNINTKASVDTGNSVAESNEGNNTMLKKIDVSN
jgi:hypothetical protein